MIHRRHFLAGTASLGVTRVRPARAASTDAGGVPACGTLVFRVSRNDCDIGTHRIEFSRNGAALRVRIDADFRVHFGPLTFYRYRHQGVEQWQAGRFASLQTETDDNGNRFKVQARRTGAGVQIRATGLPDQMVPDEALPLTHWAMADMATPLFNPQTGKMLTETVRPRGACIVTLADGARIAATRFALCGAAPIDDYYDSARLWAALDATGKDGSKITYRRL